jgi:hypothetical protein
MVKGADNSKAHARPSPELGSTGGQAPERLTKGLARHPVPIMLLA